MMGMVDSMETRSEQLRARATEGIRTDIANYGLPYIPRYPFTPEACPDNRTLALADVDTRLKALNDRMQERLINGGYAVCDVAMRRHDDAQLAVPDGFPYPTSGIDSKGGANAPVLRRLECRETARPTTDHTPDFTWPYSRRPRGDPRQS
jgi:hypothetical protein